MIAGAGILLVLTLLAGFAMPLPRVFARPGEDRSALEPWHPSARPLVDKAKKGDSKAMLALASLYTTGGEIEPDADAARRWLTRAAEAGNGDAMIQLGIFALNGGRGTPSDPTAAFKWFHRSAQAGNVTGMIDVAVCYAKGTGTGVDRQRAIEWARRALAASGNDANTRAKAASMLAQLGG
jgi:TPR repeat protein